MSTPAPTEPARCPHGGALPTFVVVGAMKCGTTSLHYYLRMHPEVGMSAQKELAYFVTERNWGRGEHWYRRQFDAAKAVRGEASPQYTCYPRFQGVAERMHAAVPDARLVYLVRDPVERIVSHYGHEVAQGTERRPFAEAVLAPGSRYVARSRYHLQIEQFLPYYDPADLLVVDQADLLADRRATLRRVFAFVGADPDVWDPRFRLERHRSARKRRLTPAGERLASTPPMRALKAVPVRYRWPVEDLVYYPFSRPVERPAVGDALRAALVDRLADDVSAWRAFTGRAFAHWSV